MAELATVTRLDDRRRPAWSPTNPKHSWLDIDEDGHHHKCVHCWVRYHSEPNGSGGWVKVWDHGPRSGRSATLGPCPGPSGRPVLAVVPDLPVEVPAQPPVADAPTKLCARCNPPCGRPGRLYAGGLTCDPTAVLVAEANAAHLRGLRAATSGMGVLTAARVWEDDSRVVAVLWAAKQHAPNGSTGADLLVRRSA